MQQLQILLHKGAYLKQITNKEKYEDIMKYDLCPFCGCVVFIITETVCDELGYMHQEDVGWECFHCGNWDVGRTVYNFFSTPKFLVSDIAIDHFHI